MQIEPAAGLAYLLDSDRFRRQALLPGAGSAGPAFGENDLGQVRHNRWRRGPAVAHHSAGRFSARVVDDLVGRDRRRKSRHATGRSRRISCPQSAPNTRFPGVRLDLILPGAKLAAGLWCTGADTHHRCVRGPRTNTLRAR